MRCTALWLTNLSGSTRTMTTCSTGETISTPTCGEKSSWIPEGLTLPSIFIRSKSSTLKSTSKDPPKTQMFSLVSFIYGAKWTLQSDTCKGKSLWIKNELNSGSFVLPLVSEIYPLGWVWSFLYVFLTNDIPYWYAHKGHGRDIARSDGTHENSEQILEGGGFRALV